MAAEVKNKTLIQNETIILKRECRSKEIFKQLRYLNCLKKEILNSNFYTYYTRGETMITFENITQTKSVYTQFLPILLIPLITPYLKKADIPFKTLGLED